MREYRVIEIDVLRGYPGQTSMTTIMANSPNEAAKKVAELYPGMEKVVITPYWRSYDLREFR